jgi:hypothetical protein
LQERLKTELKVKVKRKQSSKEAHAPEGKKQQNLAITNDVNFTQQLHL